MAHPTWTHMCRADLHRPHHPIMKSYARHDNPTNVQCIIFSSSSHPPPTPPRCTSPFPSCPFGWANSEHSWAVCWEGREGGREGQRTGWMQGGIGEGTYGRREAWAYKQSTGSHRTSLSNESLLGLNPAGFSYSHSHQEHENTFVIFSGFTLQISPVPG